MIRRFLLALAFSFPVCAIAQPARVTFTANNVLDSGGSLPLASGKLCFVTTDAKDVPMGYRVGANAGQTSASADAAPCAVVTNGAISPIQIINSAASSPLNANIRVVTKDANDAEIRRSKFVQTGTAAAMTSWCSQAGAAVTCNWDQYPIGTVPIPLVTLGPQGPTGPSGCVTLGNPSGCTGDFNPTSLNAFEVHVQNYAGADLSAQFTSAMSRWSASTAPLKFVVDSPGTLPTTITLPAQGAQILWNASATLNAVINMTSGSQIRCGAGVTLTVGTSVGSVFVSSGASNISIEGCTATTPKTGAQTDGSYLYSSTGGSGNAVRNTSLTGMGAASFNGTDDAFATGNKIYGGDQGHGGGVVSAGNAKRTTVIGNSFNNIRNGFEVFNIDVDPNHGGPTSRSPILATGGGHRAVGNACKDTGACIWGSGTHDFVITGNTADGCGDVCYDLEGTVDSVVSSNTAKGCANGCGTVFFFSQNNHFDGNDFSSTSGGPLIKVYNSTNVAAFNTGLMVTNNRLHCETVQCGVFGGDAAANPFFGNNVVTDGFTAFGLNASGGVYRGNDFLYTMTSTHSPLQPGSFGGNTTILEGNTIRSTVTQTNYLPAIQLYAADFNQNVSFILEKNKMLGGFPVDIKMSSIGGNAPGITAFLIDNYESANSVVRSPTATYDNVSEPRKFISVGGNWVPVNTGAVTKTCTTYPTVSNGVVTGC